MRRVVFAYLVLSACARGEARVVSDERTISPAIAAQRDAFRRPVQLVASLGLRPGDRVADVGAGDGYLSYRLAAAVGARGRVVATDVSAVALLRLVRRGALANVLPVPVEPRLVRPDAPGLESHAYDLILLAEVDHYLDHPVAYFGALAGALAPGGRLVIANRTPHRAAALSSARAAGWVLDHEDTSLPAQSVLVFVRKESP